MVHICIMRRYAIDFLVKKSVLNGKTLFKNTDLYILLSGYDNSTLYPD